MMDCSTYRQEVIRCLALLAADANRQVEHLENLGVRPSLDELALEFGDVAIMTTTAENSGWISAQEAAALRVLDQELDRISGQDHKNLWDEAALATREWQAIRTVAKQALDRFHAE